MRAKALICEEGGAFTLSEVTLPDPGPRHLVVRCLCSGVSIGTEFALVQQKISWGPFPLCLGYQAVGIVEAVGDDVSDYRVGQRIYYRNQGDMRLPDRRAVSCVTGTHCSHVVVDLNENHGLGPMPEGVGDEEASLFVMPAVGLNGVDMSNVRMGDTVVVYGAGLIGLGVVAACSHRGAVVIAVDIEASRLEVACRLGADHVINANEQDVAEEVARLTGEGADVVFESTGIAACIDVAMPLCRQKGTFVWQGNYGAAPIQWTFMNAHARELTTFFPMNDGLEPSRRAVLKNMRAGALPWASTITHRLTPAETPAFYTRINDGGAADVLGAVIRWSD